MLVLELAYPRAQAPRAHGVQKTTFVGIQESSSLGPDTVSRN